MAKIRSSADEAFLAEYDPRAFPPVAVTADVVALTIRDGQLCVLLVRRARPPEAGLWALPGSFLRTEGAEPETLENAAARALAVKTGLTGLRAAGIHLEQLRTYGDPGRDPRMAVVSVAYVAFAPALPEPAAGTGVAQAAWLPVSTLGLPEPGLPEGATVPETTLAFDHARIVADAVERARSKIEYTALAAAFAGPQFTLAGLRRVYEAVWSIELHASNFARKVLASPGFVEPAGSLETSSARGGRPAELYRAGAGTLLQPAILRPRRAKS